jgi:hypothetical protein
VSGLRSSETPQQRYDKETAVVVIIAGSRSFTDIALVRAAVRASGWQSGIMLIISGGAAGIDRLAERYADEQAIAKKIMPADWSNISVPGAIVRRNSRGLYNAAAGMQRNELMATTAIVEARHQGCEGGLILVWDGKSSGSANMQQVALRHHLRLFEYIPNQAAL